MNRFIVLHRHEYGEDRFSIETDMSKFELNQDHAKLAKKVGIDFDPYLDEEIYLIEQDAEFQILKADW